MIHRTLSGRAVRLFVFACVLSSRCLVCRPSHLCVCRVGTPPARKYPYLTYGTERGTGRSGGAWGAGWVSVKETTFKYFVKFQCTVTRLLAAHQPSQSQGLTPLATSSLPSHPALSLTPLTSQRSRHAALPALHLLLSVPGCLRSHVPGQGQFKAS